MELCACAHVKVGWTTQKNPDGSTSGWWECLSECGAKFVPALDPSPEALARARELVDKYIPPALLLGNIAPIQNAIAQTIQEKEDECQRLKELYLSAQKAVNNLGESEMNETSAHRLR